MRQNKLLKRTEMEKKRVLGVIIYQRCIKYTLSYIEYPWIDTLRVSPKNQRIKIKRITNQMKKLKR